jgi:hypothetical protein
VLGTVGDRRGEVCLTFCCRGAFGCAQWEADNGKQNMTSMTLKEIFVTFDKRSPRYLTVLFSSQTTS